LPEHLTFCYRLLTLLCKASIQLHKIAQRSFQKILKCILSIRSLKIQEEREKLNIKTLAIKPDLLRKRKIAKPLVVCLSIAFIISMLSAFSVPATKAATMTPALHTSGSLILDVNGNTVYLRGMGLAGFAPDMILWGQDQSDNWGNQWNYNPTTVMDQTFSAMQSQWHINMIRVFVYPSWYYRDNIAPSQESSSYASSTTPISVKGYLRTLCAEADKYGIYVDIVPYMLTPSSSSFDKDPYVTSSSVGGQGLPMSGWDSAATSFLSAAGYGNNELGFWSWFWADMANNLKGYPNAIFEAWNEPQPGADNAPITSGYLNYLTTMYSAIRGTGSTNLIMMQYHMGWFPNGYGNDLSWIKQIATAIPSATNIVYTTHLYYHAPSDLTSYWKTDYIGLKTQLQAGIATMGITAPLVVNEEGSCLTSSSNQQADYTWWQNLVLAQRDLNIGAGAYYWLSDAGLGGVYSGETMLSTGYSPNTMGQSYINAYIAPTSTPTPSPTATPTAIPTTRATPTPTTTLTPTPTPAPPTTPTATPQPTNTPQPTDTTTPTPTKLPLPTQSPTPLPTQPSKPGNSHSSTSNSHGRWYGFNLPILNGYIFNAI
jgi:hypothetical protein